MLPLVQFIDDFLQITPGISCTEGLIVSTDKAVTSSNYHRVSSPKWRVKISK